MIDLDADESAEAIKSWAKDDIVNITSIRFDIAKFFFSVSSFSLGFFATAWKLLRDKDPFSFLVLFGLSFLAISLLLSISIFWPVFYGPSESSDLVQQHKDLAGRIKVDGVSWLSIWLLGAGISAYGTFF